MAAQPDPSLILSFEEARHVVEAHAARLRPCGKELADLLEATGQVLAEPVVADRNFPPFPRAARDGYALRAADLRSEEHTSELQSRSDLVCRLLLEKKKTYPFIHRPASAHEMCCHARLARVGTS